MKLWEIEHPYYCNEGNFFNRDCYNSYESFTSFLDNEGDNDLDLNLLFRWDWVEYPNDDGTPAYDGDDNKNCGELKLFFVCQRKSFNRSVDIAVCRADEAAVVEYLKPRLQRLKELWEPLV